MNKLVLGTAALALLSACGNDQKGAAPDAPAMKELVVRAGNVASAPEALAAMALDDSGSGVLSFAESQIEGANASFTSVEITGEEALRVGNLVLEGLDMTESGASFGKLSLQDITLDQEAGFAIGNIELINPSPELAAWIAASLNGQRADFPAMDKVVFDSWSIGGLTATLNEDDMDGTFQIEEISIRDMGSLKAGRATLKGVTLDGVADQDQSIQAALGSLEVVNANAKFITAVQDNISQPEAMLGAIMDMVAENPTETGYDAIKLNDLSFDVAGASFALPSLSAFVQRNAAGKPTKYVTEPFSMRLSADPEGGEAGAGLLQGLSVLGYEALELKGEGLADYDPEADIITLAADKNYIELVDGAKFSMGAKLGGYAAYNRASAQAFDFAALAEGGEPDPNAMQAAFSQLILHGFELNIADDTLLDRIFNAVATSQGTDPTELKSQIGMGLAMAPMMAQGSGVDMDLVSEATGALSKFISDGGTLSFNMTPAEPLSIASVIDNPDPSAYTKDSLGLSMTHK